MAEKNKPCPKCNSLIYRVVKVSGWFRLECGCGIMFNPFVNTEAEMWQKWNHRPQIKETKLKSDNSKSEQCCDNPNICFYGLTETKCYNCGEIFSK